MVFLMITRFNGVFSRNDLPRIKDEAYVKNLDDKNSKGTKILLYTMILLE